MKKYPFILSACLALFSAGSLCPALIIDHTCTDIFQIPDSCIMLARDSFNLTYGHTSHGSQVVTGMETLRDSLPIFRYFDDHYYYLFGPGNPQAPDTVLSFWDYVPGGDLGNPDWVTWAGLTDTMLSNADSAYTVYPHERNLVLWSWCGQVSWADSIIIANYLSLMNGLELSYPAVTFVYMTSHLDGTGAEGNLNLRNEQIREYCRANDKVLFDFADIESYDPDGLVNYMPLYCTDACNYDSSGTTVNWAASWIARNPNHELTRLSNACGSCAHSEQLNCILKARAFWWMMARLAGWSGPTGVAVDRPLPAPAPGFRLWPNPVRALSQLRFSRPGEYKIYNALGQLVADCDGTSPITVKCEAGVYFIRENDRCFCRRLIVVR